MEGRSGFSVLCLLAGISVTEELLRVILSSTSSSRPYRPVCLVYKIYQTDWSVWLLDRIRQTGLSSVQNVLGRLVCVSPRMAYTD